MKEADIAAVQATWKEFQKTISADSEFAKPLFDFLDSALSSFKSNPNEAEKALLIAALQGSKPVGRLFLSSLPGLQNSFNDLAVKTDKEKEFYQLFLDLRGYVDDIIEHPERGASYLVNKDVHEKGNKFVQLGQEIMKKFQDDLAALIPDVVLPSVDLPF